MGDALNRKVGMAESGLGASTESCLAVGTYLVARGKNIHA